jgi:hypothetical protein
VRKREKKIEGKKKNKKRNPLHPTPQEATKDKKKLKSPSVPFFTLLSPSLLIVFPSPFQTSKQGTLCDFVIPGRSSDD